MTFSIKLFPTSITEDNIIDRPLASKVYTCTFFTISESVHVANDQMDDLGLRNSYASQGILLNIEVLPLLCTRSQEHEICPAN